MERHQEGGGASPSPSRSERRNGLQPLRLGSPSGAALWQWVFGLLIGLALLITFRTPQGGASTAEILSFLSVWMLVRQSGRSARWLPGSPSRFSFVIAACAAALLGLAAINALFGLDIEFAALTGALVLSGGFLVLANVLAKISSGGVRVRRIVVIGSPRGMDSLRRELEVNSSARFEVVGWVPDSDEAPAAGDDDLLGPLGSLRSVVLEHSVDLLVMTGEASRMTVFNEVARSCLDLPVRFCELSSLHEDLFGHVPVTEINTAWFQYIVHPRYDGATPAAKRVLDIVLACLVGLLAAPLVAVAALFVRRDGGPVFFKQRRIGEGGQPFVLYKLRTMTPSTQQSAQWAGDADPRITRVGKLLRRTHVDELPQILNILRGEMSMVGPRPEQPEFVERLEHLVPFYQRRHLIKPGLTGWAQVKCGYAGSDRGSLWKVSHDLYYVKHRSVALDLAIMWDTALELLRPRPHVVTDAMVGWVFDQTEWNEEISAEQAGEIAPAVTADAAARAAR